MDVSRGNGWRIQSMRRRQKESRRIQGMRDKERVGTNPGCRQDQHRVWRVVCLQGMEPAWESGHTVLTSRRKTSNLENMLSFSPWQWESWDIFFPPAWHWGSPAGQNWAVCLKCFCVHVFFASSGIQMAILGVSVSKYHTIATLQSFSRNMWSGGGGLFVSVCLSALQSRGDLVPVSVPPSCSFPQPGMVAFFSSHGMSPGSQKPWRISLKAPTLLTGDAFLQPAKETGKTGASPPAPQTFSVQH